MSPKILCTIGFNSKPLAKSEFTIGVITSNKAPRAVFSARRPKYEVSPLVELITLSTVMLKEEICKIRDMLTLTFIVALKPTLESKVMQY